MSRGSKLKKVHVDNALLNTVMNWDINHSRKMCANCNRLHLEATTNSVAERLK